jgi:hypothetical protein
MCYVKSIEIHTWLKCTSSACEFIGDCKMNIWHHKKKLSECLQLSFKATCKWAIISPPYHGVIKLLFYEMMMMFTLYCQSKMFIVLAQWKKNKLYADISLHSIIFPDYEPSSICYIHFYSLMLCVLWRNNQFDSF